MNKKSITDLFDIEDPDSLVRQIPVKYGTIDLTEFDMPTFKMPRAYKRTEFKLDKENYGKEIRANIEPIIQEAEKKGYARNIFTALYETVLNAYQHGNKFDPNKKITIGNMITNKELNIVVVDEGGILDPNFMNWVLWHRGKKQDSNKGYMNFYGFSQREKEKPEENLGTGTTFMHLYADSIKYYKSEKSGLAVKINKKIK